MRFSDWSSDVCSTALLEVQIPVLDRSDAKIGVVHTARVTVDEVAGTAVTTRSSAPFDPRRGNPVTTSSVLMSRTCFYVVGVFSSDERRVGKGRVSPGRSRW